MPKWPFKKKDDLPPIVITHHTILESIEALGRLELVKHNFKEITEVSQKNENYLWFFETPDSKAILITSGEAVGCIDLTKVKLNDINVFPDSVSIRLPKPELCYYKLDLNNTKLYSFETGYLTKKKDFIDNIYKNAEKQILNAALKSGILDQTKKNAELILRPFLEEISNKKVFIYYDLNTNLKKD